MLDVLKIVFKGLCGCSVVVVTSKQTHFKFSHAAFRLAPPIGELLVISALNFVTQRRI